MSRAADHHCPHCDQPLKAFTLPDGTGWDNGVHYACFNNDCPYYRKGWEHMEQHYMASASYRYRIDPATGTASPLGVWSDDACRNLIVEEPDE